MRETQIRLAVCGPGAQVVSVYDVLIGSRVSSIIDHILIQTMMLEILANLGKQKLAAESGLGDRAEFCELG